MPSKTLFSLLALILILLQGCTVVIREPHPPVVKVIGPHVVYSHGHNFYHRPSCSHVRNIHSSRIIKVHESNLHTIKLSACHSCAPKKIIIHKHPTKIHHHRHPTRHHPHKSTTIHKHPSKTYHPHKTKNKEKIRRK